MLYLVNHDYHVLWLESAPSRDSNPHCPENNLNFRLKSEPVAVGAEATVYVWILGQIYELNKRPKTR